MPADSLMPRTDSFNARVRGASHIDFKTATTGVAAKAMRNELSALVNTVKDPETRKVRPSSPLLPIAQMIEIGRYQAFDTEMQSFFYLFTRYLAERARSQELYAFLQPPHARLFTQVSSSDWDRIASPSEDKIVPYSKLPTADASNLNKLAVLKVNGGLGTSMGASDSILHRAIDINGP